MNINEKIFELFDYIDEYSLEDDEVLKKHLDYVDLEWGKLPDSKLDDTDRTLLADTMIDCYLRVKKFVEARNWIDIYLYGESFPEEVAFHNGRLEFEKGNFKEAYDLFDKAYKLSKGRMMQGKGKYQEFYLDPEKHIQS